MATCFRTIYPGLFVVILSLLTFQAAADEDDAGEATCRGVPIAMTAAQKAVVGDCLKKQGLAKVTDLKPEHHACFGICVWKGKGLLTAEGKLDHDKTINYIETIMRPEEVKKPMKEGIEECFNKFGGKVLDDGDPKCKAYDETGNCVHNVYLKNCH